MFAINGRLIATICIVGFLVASLGMYEAFRPQQAEADCSTIGRVHDYLSVNTDVSSGYTGNERYERMNCPKCLDYPTSRHKLKEWGHTYDSVALWKHRWFWKVSWDYCHSHSGRLTALSWHLVLCNRSGGGDN